MLKLDLNLGLKLGNDIVDLSINKTKLKHLEPKFLKFLHRVFTPEEQAKILNTIDLDKPKILWALWAAKEAAYKALKKQLPELIFSHNKFAVETTTLADLNNLTENNKITGILLYNHKLISMRWEYSINYIHCIAVILNNNKNFNNWEKINHNITEDLESLEDLHDLNYLKPYFTERELASVFSKQSLKTRYYAKKFLISCNFDPNIEIIRSNSPPMLFVGDQQLIDNDISLSHDGRFMAVCCYGCD